MEESLTAEVGHRGLPSQAVEKGLGLQGKLQELLVAVGPIQDSGCDSLLSPHPVWKLSRLTGKANKPQRYLVVCKGLPSPFFIFYHGWIPCAADEQKHESMPNNPDTLDQCYKVEISHKQYRK